MLVLLRGQVCTDKHTIKKEKKQDCKKKKKKLVTRPVIKNQFKRQLSGRHLVTLVHKLFSLLFISCQGRSSRAPLQSHSNRKVSKIAEQEKKDSRNVLQREKKRAGRVKMLRATCFLEDEVLTEKWPISVATVRKKESKRSWQSHVLFTL